MTEEAEQQETSSSTGLNNSTDADKDVLQSESSSRYDSRKAKNETIREYEQFGKTSSQIMGELKRIVDTESNKIKNEADKTKKELEEKIENSKLTIIETLGIFVALFTFISVDFQVFRSYRNPWAVAGLTLAFLGSISFLLVIFDFYILQARAIKNKANNIYNKNIIMGIWDRVGNYPVRFLLFAMSFIFIFCGLFIFIKSPVDDLGNIKDEIRDDVLKSVQENLKNQKNELEKTNNDSLENIKKCVQNFGITYRCFK